MLDDVDFEGIIHTPTETPQREDIILTLQHHRHAQILDLLRRAGEIQPEEVLTRALRTIIEDTTPIPELETHCAISKGRGEIYIKIQNEKIIQDIMTAQIEENEKLATVCAQFKKECNKLESKLENMSAKELIN